MKTRNFIARSGALLLLSTLLYQLSTCRASAQGTAFLYQGREVNLTGQPINNLGANLKFNLYHRQGIPPDSYSDSLFGTITTNSVSIVNGLFSLELDFGTGAFDGSDCWLEIQDVTGAPSTIVTFPKQHIVAVPYATMAGNVAANAVTGASIPSGQVVKSFDGLFDVVSLLAGANISLTTNGNTLTIASSESGQLVTGNVATQPNANYSANDANQQVTFSLPTTASVGDVVQVSGLGAGGWQILGSESENIIGYQVGTVWTQRGSIGNWISIASSADGTKLIAADNDGTTHGYLYTSLDSGVTWTAQTSAGKRNWTSVAASSDGGTLMAADYGGLIYVWTIGGQVWTAQTSAGTRNWTSVATSVRGADLIAVANEDYIYTWSLFGNQTWTQRDNMRAWESVACSADGTKLVAAAFGDHIYTSTDSGVTWIPRDSNRLWLRVASSADGSKLVAVEDQGHIYTSADSGVTWTARDSIRQ